MGSLRCSKLNFNVVPTSSARLDVSFRYLINIQPGGLIYGPSFTSVHSGEGQSIKSCAILSHKHSHSTTMNTMAKAYVFIESICMNTYTFVIVVSPSSSVWVCGHIRFRLCRIYILISESTRSRDVHASLVQAGAAQRMRGRTVWMQVVQLSRFYYLILMHSIPLI